MPSWSAGSKSNVQEMSGVVIQGEAVSGPTPSNMPVVRGRAVTASDVKEKVMGKKTMAGVLLAALCCAGLGAVPIVIIFLIFQRNGGLEAPCDVPVAFWLYLTAILGIVSVGANVVVNAITLLCGKKDEEGKLQQPPLAALVQCCVVLPISIFSLYWYIKGNQWVWGTFPFNASHPEVNHTEYAAIARNASGRLNLMDEGTLPAGLGCDPGLLAGSKSWLIATYAIIPGMVVLICCVMCVVLCCVMRAKA